MIELTVKHFTGEVGGSVDLRESNEQRYDQLAAFLAIADFFGLRETIQPGRNGPRRNNVHNKIEVCSCGVAMRRMCEHFLWCASCGTMKHKEPGQPWSSSAVPGMTQFLRAATHGDTSAEERFFQQAEYWQHIATMLVWKLAPGGVTLATDEVQRGAQALGQEGNVLVVQRDTHGSITLQLMDKDEAHALADKKDG